MPNLNDSNPITVVGSYEIRNLAPGAEYLIALKSLGAFTAILEFWDQAAGALHSIDDGEFPDANASTEKRVIAPSQLMNLTVDSISAPISVTIIKITQ